MEEIICTYDHVSKELTPHGSSLPCRLNDFIQSWNKQSNRQLLPIDVKSDFNLRIVYHSCKDLYGGNDYDFGQNCYEVGKHSDFLPTIHLTLFRIFEEQFSKEELNNGKNEEYALVDFVRRYKKVIDSSIWNFYVPIKINGSEFDFEDFEYALCEIGHNNDEGRYELDIAIEYADINSRLLGQSHLNGHHKSVSPFLFHSESIIKEKQKEITDSISMSKNKLHWRFLLIDDKVMIMESDGSIKNRDCYLSLRNGEFSNRTKTEILQDRLSSLGFSCDITQKPSAIQTSDIEIVCVDNIDDAMGLMKHYEFDIILLDYLLRDEYGFKLLSEVKKRYDNNDYTYGDKKDNLNHDKIIIGPQKKIFVMFISAFTTAVKERLTMEGFSRDEDIWLIGEGACPTNTPELFKYRLLHLMKRRLEQTGISDLNEKKILEIVKCVFPLPPEHSDEGEIKYTRERAYSKYRDVLGLHYDYSILRDNDKGKSALVDSFFERQVHLGAVLEHLLQMIHLIAFGTVRQWPEIWEEFQAFARTIIVTEDNDKSTLNQLSQEVDKYIIKLKA